MKWKFPAKQEFPKEVFEEYPKFFRNILFSRGILSKDQLDEFVYSTKEFYDPFLIYGMKIAIDRISEAKSLKQRVYIYGDYDVDGITATSILWDFLFRQVGLDVLPYIPSRFDEGYGMSRSGLDKIVSDEGKLVITVDCGIRDIELVKEYKEKGVDFIITDHHSLPTDEKNNEIVSTDAVAVIHPSHPKTKYPFKEICGAAVAWKFICGITQGLSLDFDPKVYLDLVSLATVTDIMPLVDENRLMLKEGLKRISDTKNIGLKSLIIESKVEPDQVEVYHYGFVIGPRLNAAGRIAHALDGVRLLTTQNESTARELSKKLTDLNITRQGITTEILTESKDMIVDKENNVHVVFGKGWSEGVVGLVAGKLQEEFYKPVFVGTLDGEYITGSARSISGFNVTEALESAKHLLKRFGGHAQAAGFTVHKDNAEDLREHLISYANENISIEQLVRVLEIDTIIEEKDINIDSCELIEMLKPFGYKNKTPILLIENCRIKSIKFIGKESAHIKLSVTKGLSSFEIIGFNKAVEFKKSKMGDIIDVVGNLEKNVWNGNISLQFKLIDYKKNESRK